MVSRQFGKMDLRVRVLGFGRAELGFVGGVSVNATVRGDRTGCPSPIKRGAG